MSVVCVSARTFFNLADCLLTLVVFFCVCVCVFISCPSKLINNDTIILPPLPLSITVCVFGRGTGVGHSYGYELSLPPCPALLQRFKAPERNSINHTSYAIQCFFLFFESWRERPTQSLSYILVNAVLHQISQFC